MQSGIPAGSIMLIAANKPVIMLSVIMLSVILLSVIMLSVTFIYCLTERHNVVPYCLMSLC
jgi:hypothetical protein